MKQSAKGSLLLGCIDEGIGIRDSFHPPFTIFVILLVPSSQRNFEFLRAKKKAQKAFDNKRN
jgi:hypothetical protein